MSDFVAYYTIEFIIVVCGDLLKVLVKTDMDVCPCNAGPGGDHMLVRDRNVLFAPACSVPVPSVVDNPLSQARYAVPLLVSQLHPSLLLVVLFVCHLGMSLHSLSQGCSRFPQLTMKWW